VIIEAFQMTEAKRFDNSEWPKWLNQAWNKDQGEVGALQIVEQPGSTDSKPIEIVTLEGNHRVTWDDWIIRGVAGELYPCKPDIFNATYELVE